MYSVEVDIMQLPCASKEQRAFSDLIREDVSKSDAFLFTDIDIVK